MDHCCVQQHDAHVPEKCLNAKLHNFGLNGGENCAGQTPQYFIVVYLTKTLRNMYL